MTYTNVVESSSLNPVQKKIIPNQSPDRKLVEAINSRSFIEATKLIQEGANCEQMAQLSKPMFINIFINCICESPDAQDPQLRKLLELFVDENLSLDVNRVLDNTPEEEIDTDFIEALQGLTPLMKLMQNLPIPILAILEGQEEVVDAILDQGINFNTMKTQYSVPTSAMIRIEGFEMDIDEATVRLEDIHQLLVLALQTKNLKSVDLFLKFGINIESTYTLVPQLYNLALKAGHYEIAKTIFDQIKREEAEQCERAEQKRRVAYEQRAQEQRNEGSVPFPYRDLPSIPIPKLQDNSMVYAAQGGNLQTLQMLYDDGHSADETGCYTFCFQSPIAEALKYGNIEAAQFLLDHGAQFDIDLKDSESQMIFQQVAKYGDPLTLQLLMDLGCPMQYTDRYYSSRDLLELAVESRNEGNIRFAVSNGFDIHDAIYDLFSDDEATICLYGYLQPTENHEPLSHLQMIDLFIELGADLKANLNDLLCDAAYSGLEIEFNYLLDLGIALDPIVLTDKDETCELLLSALFGESVKIIEKMIDIGLDIELLLKDQEYVDGIMYIAIGFSSAECVKKADRTWIRLSIR